MNPYKLFNRLVIRICNLFISVYTHKKGSEK